MARKKKKKHSFLKIAMAAHRRAHFANGGTVEMWRGASKYLDESTSKARKNKQACRGRYVHDA